jgi:uncharacterized protein
VSRSVSSLTYDQCVTRLSWLSIGRVSVSINAMPVVVPVRFVLDGDSVLFRAPLDDALVAACDGAVIAFEVGDIASLGTTAPSWSVQLLGIGSRLDERDFLRVSSLGSLGASGPDLNQIVRLPTARLHGHELHATPLACAG